MKKGIIAAALLMVCFSLVSGTTYAAGPRVKHMHHHRHHHVRHHGHKKAASTATTPAPANAQGTNKQ